MDKIRVIHDAAGHTLTVWLEDPAGEYICEETPDEVVLIKNAHGKVIGLEVLHYHPGETDLAVETVIRSGA